MCVNWTRASALSLLAADAGFEPALPDPESGVLPLDESATAFSINDIRYYPTWREQLLNHRFPESDKRESAKPSVLLKPHIWESCGFLFTASQLMVYTSAAYRA